jgi:hypothetical protein
MDNVGIVVEDIDAAIECFAELGLELARLGKRGAELVGEVAQYENTYRLCYIRGSEGILIGLAQDRAWILNQYPRRHWIKEYARHRSPMPPLLARHHASRRTQMPSRS